MEQEYELRVPEIRKSVFEQSQNAELYIPLQGKHTTNSEERPFDLAEKIKQFFIFDDTNLSDPCVTLLMGDTGSGKSIFVQQLFNQLWQHRKSGDPIPLWIPLPELEYPFESAVEEVLKKQEFSESQIMKMKAKERFIFIVDGYDELHQFQNCYVTNKWDKWKAKVLITCRSQALYYQKDPDKYFVPFRSEKRLPMLLRRLYVASFSQEQISAYVRKYHEVNPLTKVVEGDFTKIPGLTELITTPFLLHLAVEALPDILANQHKDQKMTQATLYDVFIEQWFSRQVKKLSTAGLLTDTEQNTKQKFWDYCKRLAQQMHEKQVSIIPYRGQKVSGRLFRKLETTTVWESFFNEDSEVLRSACPLKRFGEHHYGFVHASMIDYFATRAMYEEIQNKMDEVIEHVEEDKPQEVKYAQELKGGIHQRVFAQEKNALRFLADRIEMSDSFKQKMLFILEGSKKSKHFSIGAANAISALVRAGTSFNGVNLSGIQISGANISGGYFDQADLSNANLSNSVMINVWLRDATIEGSNLEGINFGEYPWFNFEHDIYDIDYRESLNRLVVACGKYKQRHDIVLWDTVTYEPLAILKSHHNHIACVALSLNGQYVAWGGGYSDLAKIIEPGGTEYAIRIIEVANSKEIAILLGHVDSVTKIEFSSDNKYIISGSKDKTIRIWEVSTGNQKMILNGHIGRVNTVKFSPNGKLAASGSED